MRKPVFLGVWEAWPSSWKEQEELVTWCGGRAWSHEIPAESQNTAINSPICDVRRLGYSYGPPALKSLPFCNYGHLSCLMDCIPISQPLPRKLFSLHQNCWSFLGMFPTSVSTDSVLWNVVSWDTAEVRMVTRGIWHSLSNKHHLPCTTQHWPRWGNRTSKESFLFKLVSSAWIVKWVFSENLKKSILMS